MRKFWYIFLISMLLIFNALANGEEMATPEKENTESISGWTVAKMTDPKTLKTFYPFTWSNKGEINFTDDIPEGGKINWVKLESANVFSNCGQYREIFIHLWNENGEHIRLKPGEINKDFTGEPVTQTFYLSFYTNYMEFKGNVLIVGRPVIIFSIKY